MYIFSVVASKLLADVWNYNIADGEWGFMEGQPDGDRPTLVRAAHWTYNTGNILGGTYDMNFATAGNTLLIYGGIAIDKNGQQGYSADFWMLDCHNYVVYYNTAFVSTIFIMLFMTFAGLALAATSFIYARKYFNRGMSNNTKIDVQYSILNTQE